MSQLRYLAVFLVCLVASCGGPSRTQKTQDERQALIYALAHLDPAAPPKERAQMLDAVRSLVLADKELGATRDICLAAHEGLLEAHLLQAEARKAFADAKADDANRASHAAHAQRALDDSSKTLAGARASLDACQTHTRTLVRSHSRE